MTAFKMQQSTTAAVKLFVCVCACMGVFNHDLSGFKAAEYLFSWSEADVPPVLTFTVFHTWLTL